MNGFGKIFRLTSFGESHGAALGGVIEGCPAGIALSPEELQREVDRRRPGQSEATTGRREEDKVEILSGLFEGRTTGMPIGFVVRNGDARSGDYEALREVFRPSHADYTWEAKYGTRDWRGGGRASARETVARVVAGAVAKQVLRLKGVEMAAYTSQIGTVVLQERGLGLAALREGAEGNAVRCPDAGTAEQMLEAVRRVKAEGDSVGGVVACRITGVPAGIGEPVFDRLQARLAYAMLGINAAKGFEYGEGFGAASMRGSGHNDTPVMRDGKVRTLANHAGGILGGVSTGEEIFFRVAFKPVASIGLPQQTVTKRGEETVLRLEGRHDPCVVPRAVPVVEAMAAMVVLDLMLEAQAGGWR